jgi:Flp pilus assembly protein TadB
MTPAYKDQLDRIEKAIIGNGQEGLLRSSARMEEKIASTSILIEEAKKNSKEARDKAEEAVNTTSQLIGEIKIELVKINGSIEAHHKMLHLAEIVKKKQFWIYIFLGFVVLHLISTYVPNVWDWIMLLVGLPHLVIPVG